MSRTVLVLGTDHRFQRRSAEFTEAQHQAFAAFVLATAKQAGVAGLAEENNVAALAEAGATQSTIELMANELGLRHRYCDPNMKTRAKLDMLQENEIRISAFPEKLIEAEVQRLLTESMRVRESYWLSKLIEFNTWPVLFVCGADHSLPFLDLLNGRGINAALVAEDWGA
jgi:hypothetical protein